MHRDKLESRGPREAIGRGRETVGRALRLPADAPLDDPARDPRRDFVAIVPGGDRTRWHPRCAAFAAYVESLAAPGRLPTRGMFEPTAIYRVLPNVWIADVRRDPLRLAVRLAGSKIAEALGREPTGLGFAQAFPGGDPGLLDRYVHTIATRQGTWRRGRPLFDAGQAWEEAEEVVMPFAADGASVDMLYCCTAFYGYDRREW